MNFDKYDDGFFCIGSAYGFLPKRDPLPKVPVIYFELQKIMEDLHIFQNSTRLGILGIPNKIVNTIKMIPNFEDRIQHEKDPFVLHALFRAYAFIASGFLLESSYQECLQSGHYGRARRRLPENIAKPFVCISEKLNVHPWLDYHYAYALGNYIRIDPSKSLHWKNLDMACKFSGTKDEIGFIMLHVYINELSPRLIEGIQKEDLALCARVITEMNERRKEMWIASDPKHYNDFRIFIMGIKGNPSIFGEGVIYEGCFDNEPQQYRGQTGAQDDIIPTLDIFTGIIRYYPENELTQYLHDLRTYRPKVVQTFFHDLEDYYNKYPLLDLLRSQHDYENIVHLLTIIDQVFQFRQGHWHFVEKYIIANTDYGQATGGTPIISWLKNQILAVLEYEKDILNYLSDPCRHQDIIRCQNYQEFIALQKSFDQKYAFYHNAGISEKKQN